MDTIEIPLTWFTVICCVIVILCILILVLSILLHKAKSIAYKPFQESNEAVVTTINSNRYNIQFKDRTNSGDFVRMVTNLNLDQSNLQTVVVEKNTNSSPKLNTENTVCNNAEQTIETNNLFDNNINGAKAAVPPLIRQQIQKVCEELLHNARKTRFRMSEMETFELRDLNRIKKKSVLSMNLRERSMSTPDLDIYDVLPDANAVLPVNISVEDDGEYSNPKNERESTVILDESGYILPLTLKLSYVNANVR